MSERISCGIPKLDALIEGGFKSGSVNLLEGGAGCGKSTLAMQFLAAQMKQGVPCVYLTFEETKEDILSNMKGFSFGLSSFEKKGLLSIISVSPEEIRDLLDKQGWDPHLALIKQLSAKAVVIDSITSYTFLFDELAARKKAFKQLADSLRVLGVTSIIISEQELDISDDAALVSDASSFDVDSIIAVYSVAGKQTRVRGLEVRRMKNSRFPSEIFLMRITDKGIDIFPDEKIA